MVTGFETITYEPTKFELDVIMPIIKDGWRESYKKNTCKEVIQRRRMVDGINHILEKRGYKAPRRQKGQPVPYKLTGPRFRAIIHYMRVKGEFNTLELLANSRGYFLSNDTEQIAKFIKSCRERANSFLETADAMEMRLKTKQMQNYVNK